MGSVIDLNRAGRAKVWVLCRGCGHTHLFQMAECVRDAGSTEAFLKRAECVLCGARQAAIVPVAGVDRWQSPSPPAAFPEPA